jgi:hypothetical protein
MLNDTTLETVYLVSRVEEFNDNANTIELLLRDDTGTINGKIFRSSGSTTIKALQNFQWVPNGYASIIGTLNNNQNKQYLVVNLMRNLENYAEVSFHRAEVLWACLIRNHALKVPEVSNKSQSRCIKTETSYEELNSDQRTIMNAIQQHSNKNIKLNKDNLHKLVKLNPNKINEELQNLLDYGYLMLDHDTLVFSIV